MKNPIILKLCEEAFAKAEVLCGKKSDNGRATFLEDELRRSQVSISGKSLIAYKNGKSIPGTEVLDGLAKFLDFESYKTFHEENKIQEISEDTRTKTRSSIILWILIIALGFLLTYNMLTPKANECLVWNGNRYQVEMCSGASLEIPYKEELLDFKQMFPCSGFTFYDVDGQPIVWYDKSNGDVSFFNSLGRHPVNKKTLKPITDTIIEKYVPDCNSLTEKSNNHS
jgi:hypothetical protein